MAALSAANVKVRKLGSNPQSLPQKGSTTIYQGAIVMVDSSGYAKPGATATGCVGVGVALDNGGLSSWANSGADGASDVAFDEGVFGPFANSGTSIAVGDEGKDCYIVDDQTVHRTDGSGTRSPAGRIHSVTSEGVFVEMSRRIAREIAESQVVSTGQAYTQTYSTADRTVANLTSATLTDNSGGSGGTTLAAVTNAANAGSADVGPTKDAIASLAAQVNALRADLVDVKQAVNAVIDDLQTAGIVS